MMKRFILALRILFGLPLRDVWIDKTFLLDKNTESEFDYTQAPPFDLAFGGVLTNRPPVEILHKDRFRVCVFVEKGRGEGYSRTARWLVLELKGKKKWHHLVTMHESRLAIMLGVLQAVGDYLDDSRAADENQNPTRDTPSVPDWVSKGDFLFPGK